MQGNVLSKFYRVPKLYTVLPTGHERYNPAQVVFNDRHELGVYSMTLNDELLLKNPDALLNGEAVAKVIANCVPGVLKPHELFSADVDALMVAIRIASYGKEMDLNVECTNTECRHKNTVSADLETVLTKMKTIASVSVVNLSNGLSVFLNPATYKLSITEFQSEFEAKKFIKVISKNMDMPEDEKITKLSSAFDKIAKSQIEILVKSITKIVKEDEGLLVTDFDTILGFINNTETENISLISAKLEEINAPAVNKKFTIKCEKCEHIWDEEYDFNMTDFFTNS